jgi:hypothetical protein
MVAGRGQPEPGAYLICFGCARVTQILGDWSQRAVSEDEIAIFPELTRWRDGVREVVKERAKNAGRN